jgi:uncharacterized protein GlcG (DUF336 family)
LRRSIELFRDLHPQTRQFPNLAAWGGGLPIKMNGEVVGAIGVSGAPTVQHDVDCARAALALLPE